MAEMGVDNPHFAIIKHGKETRPLQYLRELTQNSIEAILRTGKEGSVRWTYDKSFFSKQGIRKLCIVDTGDGMTGEVMRHRLNKMYSSIGVQGVADNFGVGAKISALFRNPEGLLYKSWPEGGGSGFFCHLKELETERYGLHEFLNADTETYDEYVPIGDDDKQKPIGEHGTMVTLLGSDEADETFFGPEGAGTKWVVHNLNSKYFAFPPGISVKGPVTYHDSETGELRIKYRTVAGMRHHLEKHSIHSGTVEVTDGIIHWWVIKDDPVVRKMSDFPSISHTAALFDKELYDPEYNTRRKRKILYDFGILHLVNRMVVYAEPTGSDVMSNTPRTNLIIGDGEGVPWEEWAHEFRDPSRFPPEIRRLEEELAQNTTDLDLQDEISRRLRDFLRDFTIPKYKPSVVEELEAGSFDATGGSKPGGEEGEEPPAPEDLETKLSGHTGKNYSDTLRSKGTQSKRTEVTNPFPTVEFVTPETHPHLEDRAAEFVSAQNTLLVNEEFRGFTELVEHALADDRVDGKVGAKPIVEKITKTEYALVLAETVIRVQQLRRGGRSWSQDNIDDALGCEALTSSVLSQFHLQKTIAQRAGQQLGAAKRSIESQSEESPLP